MVGGAESGAVVRRLWERTYQALRPWAGVPGDVLDGRCAEAVRGALVVLWGDCDDGLLDAPAGDEQVHAVVAAATAYGLGWRDAVLGEVAAEAQAAGCGDGPGGLWAPGVSWDRGRGRSCWPTLRANLAFFARHEYGWELGYLRSVLRAVEAHPADPRAALTALFRTAWVDEATERRGWDDAGWWDYLCVDELSAWAVVALGLPGDDPADVGDAVVEAAEAVSPRDWTWSGDGLPGGFLDAAFAALGT